jgi:hypothetical protein
MLFLLLNFKDKDFKNLKKINLIDIEKNERKIVNKNHALKRYAYSCIITGYEYLHQCLGCGKKW